MSDTFDGAEPVRILIFAFDLEGRLLAWNDHVVRVTGYADPELRDMSFTDLLAGGVESIGEVIASGSDAREIALRAELVRKDGSREPYEFQVGPLRDHDVVTPGITVIGTDISVRSDMLDELTQTLSEKAEVEEHLEELENLFAVAAHELRHPATIFKGYSTLLLDMKGDPDPKVLEEALRSIDSSADRLVHMVEELFESALIERQEMELEYREVFPSSLIDSAMERVVTLGFDLKYAVRPFDGEPSRMTVDPVRLQEVLAILIENAAKYTPEGETVEIWFEQDDGGTVLTVADRGPGVPEKDRERIFERFYQVEDVMHHSKPGIGLGLHIARYIVDAHGGWIKMEPRDGGGTLFSFMVPVKQR